MSTSSPRGASQTPKNARRSKKKEKKTQRPSSPQILYLRVNRKFLLLFPAATAGQPNPQPLPPLPGTTGNLNIIIANLADLRPFAGDTVDWLTRVARLIFQPLGTSSLYTFTTKSLEWWLDREMEPSQWRRVNHGEQLRATIYEFLPDNDDTIALTKMSLRPMRSVTTTGSLPRASAFRLALLQRDRTCIITQEAYEPLLVASHLIPRRLGDAGVQSVVQRFTGTSAPIDRYDPTIGVLLFSPLDILADSFNLGFWNYGPDQYVLHDFVDSPRNLLGGQLNPNDQKLHGHQVTLSPHDASVSLPPVGVFDWHYIQCVLKKCSAPAYQAIDNIHHFSLPFRTRDDDDDDESDIDFDDERNIANPPYPSYLWELAELRARQHLEAEERRRAIMTWNSDVSGDFVK